MLRIILYMDIDKLIFLQPKSYFNRLGVDFNKIEYECVFGWSSLKILITDFSKVKAVVSMIDHSHILRALCHRCRVHSLPVIFIMDGVFEWSNATINPYLNDRNIKLLSPVFYDYIICRDAGLVQCLKKDGVLARQYSVFEADGDGECSVNNKILITTANTAYYNEIEYENLIVLLTEVIKTLSENLIPYCFRFFDQRLIDEFVTRSDCNLVDGSFSDALAQVSGLISTPSTIVQEAMELGVPVAILDYRDGPIFLQSGWRITGQTDILSVVMSMLSFDSDRMSFQNTQISRSNLTDQLNSIANENFFRKSSAHDFKLTLGNYFILRMEFKMRLMLEFLKNKFSKIYKAMLRFLK